MAARRVVQSPLREFTRQRANRLPQRRSGQDGVLRASVGEHTRGKGAVERGRGSDGGGVERKVSRRRHGEHRGLNPLAPLIDELDSVRGDIGVSSLVVCRHPSLGLGMGTVVAPPLAVVAS